MVNRMGGIHPEIMQWQAAVQWETVQLLRALVGHFVPTWREDLPQEDLPQEDLPRREDVPRHEDVPQTAPLDAVSVMRDLYRLARRQDEAVEAENERLKRLLEQRLRHAGRAGPPRGMRR